MRFLLPTGIGDSVWALHKIQAIRDAKAPGEPIEIALVGTDNKIETRSIDFVKRFRFVDTFIGMRPYAILRNHATRADGTLDYIEDGMYQYPDGWYCVLVPNEALEHGVRLEDWLPHYEINWDIWKDFVVTGGEALYGINLKQRIGPYAVFYPGPLAGNTVNGHNRGPRWTPQEWVELGKRIHEEHGLRIVVVGAPYDAEYWYKILQPAVGGQSYYWDSLIGQTNLGQLWNVTAQSQFVVSYQAGVGIVSTYLGTPTAIFWRQHGDSISPEMNLTFDERMASAWVPPKVLDSGTHLPLYYGRHGVPELMGEVVRRGWATGARPAFTVQVAGA